MASKEDEDDYEYFFYYIDETEQLPPLIKTKSRIIFCIVNQDLEGLKSLMDYPNLLQITDSKGYSILQIAISSLNIPAFDLLLSLDNRLIESRNKEGETALEVALSECFEPQFEHFAYTLLKKGANIDCNFNGTTLLHVALDRNYSKVAKFLIEKGVDLNVRDSDDETPINLTYFLNDADEMIAMLLYFGANLTVPDYHDFRPNDFGFLFGNVSESMRELLLLYLFDDYCTGYRITIDHLFYLLQSESLLMLQVLKNITKVDLHLHPDFIYEHSKYFFIELFTMRPEFLELLLEKFDYVIGNILKVASRKYYKNDYSFSTEMFIENFDLLLQSQFNSDLIEIFNKTKISKFIRELDQSNGPERDLFESIIILLLSYGAIVYDADLEGIYDIWGDCEFFRILLHMDIKILFKYRKVDIMPGLLYKTHVDIETFLSDPYDWRYSLEAFEELFTYFALPKLKKFCCSTLKFDEDIYAKVNNLPSVPLLVELARNQARKFLIQKYKIKNSMQFYTLIKHLPISKVHQRIITLETKLY